MMSELRSMKGLIEQRFGALAFMEKLQKSPRQAKLSQRLLDVGFSVIASYILSRTLVPTMVRYLLPGELAQHNKAPGFWARKHAAFERGFAALQRGYGRWLDGVLSNRATFLVGFLLVIALGAGVALGVGRDFFPSVDAGQIRLHITTPAGTRIEETEKRFADVEAAVAELIPAGDREGMLSQIGLPSGYSLATSDTTNSPTSAGPSHAGRRLLASTHTAYAANQAAP